MAADTEVASLYAKLGVKLDKREFGAGKLGLNDLTKAAYGTEHAAEQARAKLSALARQASAAASVGLKSLAVGLAAAASAAIALVVHTAEAGAAIADMAKRTGASVGDLQRLAYSAKQSGTELGDVEVGLRKLAKSIYDAGNAASPAAKAFAKLGLDAGALGKMGAEERLAVLADAFGKVESDVDRTAIAMILLGKAGTGLLPMFEGGGDAIRAMGAEAQRLGIVLSDEAIESADKFDDSLAKVKAQLGGVAASIGTALMPVMQDAVEGISTWVTANKDLIATRVEAFLRDVIPLVETLARMMLATVENAAKVVSAFGDVKTAAIVLGVAIAGIKLAALPGQLGLAASGFVAMKLQMLGAVAVAGALGFALGTALDNALGLSDALAGVNQQKGGRGAVPLGEMTDDERARVTAAQAKIAKGQQMLDDSVGPSPFRDMANDTINAGKAELDAAQNEARERITVRENAATTEQRRKGEAAITLAHSYALKGAAVGKAAGQGRFGELPKDKPTRPPRTRGGGGGRAKAAKPDESVLDMLEGDFGKTGEAGKMRAAAGGGASAIAGASFVRIDASFNAPTTVNVNLPRGAMGRTDEDRGRAVGDAAGGALEKRNRDAAEHFAAAVRR